MNTEPENQEDESELVSEPNIDLEEETELVDEEENLAATVKKWRDKYKVAEAKAASNLEEAQRAKADFLNSRRRLEEDLERSKERSVDDFVKSLLPLADSFSMAIGDVKNWESVDENWRKGVEGIHSQLQQILSRYSVTEDNPLGEHFDPSKHEALSTEDSDQESDTVTKVVQLGYIRNSTVIRPAKVIISN